MMMMILAFVLLGAVFGIAIAALVILRCVLPFAIAYAIAKGLGG